MAKLKIVTDGEGRFYALGFKCPGCGDHHHLPVDWTPPGYERSPNIAARPMWSFNGDMDKPVFGPSLLVRSGHHAEANPEAAKAKGCWCDYHLRYPGEKDRSRYCYLCHSFIGCNGAQPGQIVFLGDCTHAHANQTLDLPDIVP